MIQVDRLDDHTFQVTVDGPPRTSHRVTLDPADHERLSGGAAPPETLVEHSFEFLLEREPNTAILTSFELPLIGHYFPEYEHEIRGRL